MWRCLPMHPPLANASDVLGCRHCPSKWSLHCWCRLLVAVGRRPLLWSTIQKIPRANPVTLYREPTTNFPPSQCNMRICPTTMGHVLPQHLIKLPTPRKPHTARQLPMHCSLMIAVGYATYPMSLSNSMTLRKQHCKRQVRCTMTNSPAMLSRSWSSVGPCIPSTVAILHQLFNLGSCPSKSDWCVTLQSQVNHSSGNSLHAGSSSTVLQIS